TLPAIRDSSMGEAHLKEWVMIHKIKALYDQGNGLTIRAIAPVFFQQQPRMPRASSARPMPTPI
ncbi:hypothetical protein, partial [Thiolapillus sp.]|uniref:hypothetical protein n=1 Tax=Thiolapillus sp. TaxID=2017437 RepID=UPI0025D52E70